MPLNDEQITASRNRNRVSAIFAGAGSGKTTVVVDRVLWLLESGVPSHKIFLISFTKKSAEELKERVQRVVGKTDINVGTFHSICLDWIKTHCEKIGFDYGIEGIITEAEAKEAVKLLDRPLDARMQAELQAVSFDSIIEFALQLLEGYADEVLPEECHVIVDEAQDNSAAQWATVKAIAASERTASLQVVGDFRQSIYQWRQADPEIGAEFCRDNPTFVLRKNYRSGADIVYHANKIISFGGFNEPMEADESNGNGSVEFVEAMFTLESLVQEIQKDAMNIVPYSDMAVLCRYNSEADDVAAYLRNADIPVYRKKTPDNDQINKLCAWISSMANPYNKLSWSVAIGDLINYNQKREVINISARSRCSLHSATLQYIEQRGVKVSESTIEALKFMEGRSSDVPSGDVLGVVVKALGGASEIHEFARKMRDVPIANFSEQVFIRSGGDEEEPDGVTVCTAHASKGLEFSSVFVYQPSQAKSPGGKKGWRKEEERRLMFVAATRAKERLVYILREGEQWCEFLVDEHLRFLV